MCVDIKVSKNGRAARHVDIISSGKICICIYVSMSFPISSRIFLGKRKFAQFHFISRSPKEGMLPRWALTGR